MQNRCAALGTPTGHPSFEDQQLLAETLSVLAVLTRWCSLLFVWVESWLSWVVPLVMEHVGNILCCQEVLVHRKLGTTVMLRGTK